MGDFREFSDLGQMPDVSYAVLWTSPAGGISLVDLFFIVSPQVLLPLLLFAATDIHVFLLHHFGIQQLMKLFVLHLQFLRLQLFILYDFFFIHCVKILLLASCMSLSLPGAEYAPLSPLFVRMFATSALEVLDRLGFITHFDLLLQRRFVLILNNYQIFVVDWRSWPDWAVFQELSRRQVTAVDGEYLIQSPRVAQVDHLVDPDLNPVPGDCLREILFDVIVVQPLDFVQRPIHCEDVLVRFFHELHLYVISVSCLVITKVKNSIFCFECHWKVGLIKNSLEVLCERLFTPVDRCHCCFF